jgi:hypothetical protein
MVLGEADWNPVNQHLLFAATRKGSAKEVYAVSFPAAGRSPRGKWIPLILGAPDVGQPHWSSDGKTVFYLSRRDGFLCLWGRGFDPARRESPEPFAVMHYHDPRIAPDRASPLTRGLSTAGGSIFLNIGEVTDTVWLGRLTPGSPLSWWKSLSFSH